MASLITPSSKHSRGCRAMQLRVDEEELRQIAQSMQGLAVSVVSATFKFYLDEKRSSESSSQLSIHTYYDIEP